MRTLRCLPLLAVLSAGGHAVGYAASTPTPVKDILYARQFTLQQGYRSPWHREVPVVTSGYIVVLSIDPEFRKPHAGAVPVLLAGDGTVEEFNFGQPSGILVGIIPAVADLAQALIWFGPLGFADEMTSSKIVQAKAEAIAAGVTPFSAGKVSEVLAVGGEPLVLENRAALMQHVVTLIQAYHAEN